MKFYELLIEFENGTEEYIGTFDNLALARETGHNIVTAIRKNMPIVLCYYFMREKSEREIMEGSHTK